MGDGVNPPTDLTGLTFRDRGLDPSHDGPIAILSEDTVAERSSPHGFPLDITERFR
jgi:hypothetical protein